MHRHSAILTLLAAACATPSVNVQETLDPLCAEQAPYAIMSDLAQVDLPANPLELYIAVQVYPDALRLDHRPLDLDELEGALREKLEAASYLADLNDKEAGASTLSVQIASKTPLPRVRQIFGAAEASGFTQLDLIVGSSQPVPEVKLVDPAYAKDMEARLAAADPMGRQLLIAQEMEQLMGGCTEAERAFRAVATAPPEHKCALLSRGMHEALPTCWMASGDKIVTAMQLVMMPHHSHRPTAIRVELSPEGPLLVLEGQDWGSAAKLLAAQGRGPHRVRLAPSGP